jgi:hypothetical protein
MPEVTEKKKKPAPMKRRPRVRTNKKTFATALFEIIMEYRDSKIYQWVKRHPEISLAVVGLWGMGIIVLFLWFVITRVVQ